AYEIITKNMLLYLDNQEKINCMIRAAFCISKGIGVRGMVAGQVADIEAEGMASSPDMVNYIHMNKTANFIKACVSAGGYLAGADKVLMNSLDVYGENLGLAFQVVDDILDVISNKEDLGHSIGKDEQEGKCTYPSVYGLEESKNIAIELIDNARKAISGYYDNAEVLNYILDLLYKEINE
ncbi:MAG: polyprenyl synthetase family protein, partial [Bacillota bacterium]|nr:polyprenyl synthetase family protein [Bacillota bacterium]